jgi:hypothetical protein
MEKIVRAGAGAAQKWTGSATLLVFIPVPIYIELSFQEPYSREF